RIIVSPATEWPVIAAESTPTANLITGYVLPLAGAAAIAAFIGTVLIGVSVPTLPTYRTPVTTGLIAAVWSVAMAVIGVFVCAFIANALAPTFGSEKSDAQALKLAAYSFTPVWVAGLLQIFPPLGILALFAGLYAIYLLYLGLPVLMHTPADKAIGYTIVLVVCAVIAMFVIGAIGGLIFGLAAAPRMI